MYFDPNKNVAVFFKFSVTLSSDTVETQLSFLCSFITIYIYSVYLYMYEYKYIYIYGRYMNIYKDVYSVRRLVVYILLCENSCQSQTGLNSDHIICLKWVEHYEMLRFNGCSFS